MTTFDLLIRNAVIPQDGTDSPEPRTIATRAGRIAAIAGRDEDLGSATRTLDAEGRWVIPGAIDSHTHIGQLAPEFSHLPGMSEADNYTYETRAAIAGGCTTALNYAPFGQGSVVEAYQSGVAAATAQSRMNVLFHGYVMNDKQLAELPDAVAAGMRTFKMFMPYRGAEACALGGIGSLDHAQLRLAFQAIAAHGCQALVHAEDGDIVAHCTAEETRAGMPDLESYERGRPVEAEGDATWTALYLAERAGCPVSIVHVSSLEAIRARRALGYPAASLESCPHYMLLHTGLPIGPAGKVAPPLRGPELADQITSAVLAGEIDFFGSDHNVWPAEAKPNLIDGRAGLPGVGLLLPLLLTHLVFEHGLSMSRAVALTSTNAARKFGLTGKGRVAVGADADLVVLDTGRRIIRAQDLHSAVDYSPYEGMELRAWSHATVLGGRVVYAGGEFVGDDVRGEILNHRYTTAA
ncbi:MAG: dihydropyrimidinase [Pseudonocardiales bacterium]|jgi:dihydroorotase-like cyclic amidohydrolase|nr:dihydropyrimidinase [Pseudonocardiales bacterium]MDT7673012.1 dihydropyrimidinase [Pseudonocardiales bacterium]MDT7687058.1 dihydropyrimidinase [Pseudonocardiales bacterium]